MDKQRDFVLRTIEERGVKFIRLWFTDVIGTLPLGKAEMYTGDNAVLVFNHQEKDCLLVVIDQRPDSE